MQPQPTSSTITFSASAPEIVVTAAERFAAGLDHWVDGTMGFLRLDGRVLVAAPNGPKLAIHDLAAGGFIDGLVRPDAEIGSLAAPLDHASGGSLHFDDETGAVFLSYHGEFFADGDASDYWSVIGMAVSWDRGETFVDLGPIITSEFGIGDPSRPHPIDLASGAMVVAGGSVDVYFQDRAIYTTRRQLSVARAPIEEVRAAAADGRPPYFRKLHDGVFESPGLGGTSDEIMPRCEWRPVWFDATLLGDGPVRLLVFTSGQRVGDTYHHMHFGMCSIDGIRWSAPALIYPGDTPGEMLYVSVDGSVEPGAPRFDLYRVRSEDSVDRWRDAVLERIEVTYDLDLGDEASV